MSTRLLPLLVLGGLIASPSSGQESTATGNDAARPTRDATVEVGFLTHEKQVMVPVHVNGHGPHRFTLDTGSDMPVCVDTGLVQKLDLPVTGQIGNSGATGRVVQRDLVGLDSVTLGGVILQSRRALAADYSWISPAGNPAVEGILGFPLFRDRLLTIDYPRRVVRLGGEELAADGDHVVPFANGASRPHVTIEVGGERLVALMDTGSTSGIVLPDRLRASLAFDAGRKVVGRLRSVNGVGGRVWRARLRGDVTVAGHTLRTPTVSFYEKDDDAMLGGAVLKGFALTFDQRNRRIRFSARR